MPIYFFHIRSPTALLVDEVGLELRDLDEARATAEQGACDIMAEDLKAGREIDHQSFEVFTEDGKLALVLVFRDVLRFPNL